MGTALAVEASELEDFTGTNTGRICAVSIPVTRDRHTANISEEKLLVSVSAFPGVTQIEIARWIGSLHGSSHGKEQEEREEGAEDLGRLHWTTPITQMPDPRANTAFLLERG
ncbi:hypothetical protein [Flaviflexus ciconiae]|uniref:hypothetical protein n=1 Tax=Flaviflexus ciconiae TaxID=2496867 RepID=UPI0013DF9A42|nr:hypothetical protein [Flaviflexus ciconiae]